MTIREEQKAFDAQLEELLPKHRGEYVLFKDGKAVGFFKTNQLAYADGIARFGPDQVFLVGQVERQPIRSVSLAWDAGVLVG